jgi:catechol 2,3-dioxygenase-like lactoylglutathione lyase family enzyme
MAIAYQVTFDCADPAKLSEFWAATLGYRLDSPPPGFASWPDFLKAMNVPEENWNDASAIVDPDGVGSRIYFQKVPEDKVVKNRLHLDVRVSGPRGTPLEERRGRIYQEVERLKGLGATQFYAHDKMGEFWVIMQDPEGNEFCLT